ncbi:MAG TPA: hypothetical protein VEC35_07825 [Noviherbaspirillum sp.]|nr:hypothetical protein [Noviherbaspirillum sp.]
MIGRGISACTLLAAAIATHAQGYRQVPAEQRIAEGQRLFDHYSVNMRNKGMAAREYLDGAYTNGIAQTPENVHSVRTLLASKVTVEEKAGLVRILGRLYTQNDITGMNAVIVQDLKGLVNSGEKDVARAAALAFSRLAYFRDSSDVLLRARNSGAIDDDGYYGELAHMVAVAPASDQVQLVRRIREGKNKYAMEILASFSRSPQQLARMHPETRSAILGALEENEPAFPMALGEFGLIDAMRYTDWLQSVALLGSNGDNVKYIQLVLVRLGDERLDPRKAMAFLAAPDGKALIREVGKKSAFSGLLERIALYSKQLPQNELMKEMVRDVAQSVGALH